MNRTSIHAPPGATYIMQRLQENGYRAYAVGGCVRDSLLGRTPHDWDICTSATPEEMKRVFGEHSIYDVGIKHGTLSIVANDEKTYEVTTFRSDGIYSDNRHPDTVSFVKELREDLSRRDFTINAMAYSESTGLTDYFGGVIDLEKGILRCVGNPNERFHEDALRVLRALRFASVYGFSIAPETADAIHMNAPLLNNIAAERIREELCKLLFGSGVLRILLDFSDVFSIIIPELKPCVGFEQHNRFHQYNVYDHIAHATANYTGDDLSVKTALLLHDIGKPLCYSEDENGGHFHGHGVQSHDLAENALDRLRFDNRTKREVLELVLYHDAIIEPTVKAVKRWLGKIGEEQFLRLILVRIADIRAHAEGTQDSRIIRCQAMYDIVRQVLEEKACFSLENMAINGNDIIGLGVPQGKRVGEFLNILLDKVISGDVENDRDALLLEAGKLL